MIGTRNLAHRLGTKGVIAVAAGLLLAAGLAHTGTAAADEPNTATVSGPAVVIVSPLSTGKLVVEGAPVLMSPMTDGEGAISQ